MPEVRKAKNKMTNTLLMTNFPILTTQPIDMAGFIRFWKQHYQYDPERTQELYLTVSSKETYSEKDLRKLFEWKNGLNLSGKKENSLKKKILPYLDQINAFKKQGETDFNKIRAAFKNVSAIWFIFLAHTINKEAFPIFDQHVYRAMNYLESGQIGEIPSRNPKKISIYQERYLPLYKQYRNDLDNYKDWDEAFWAFGKFLGRYPKAFVQ